MDDQKQMVPALVNMPAVVEIGNLAVISEQFSKLQQFIKAQMKRGKDFGVIPGCKKPSLYKAGAEKLLNLHGLACRLSSTKDTVLDWKNGFFNYCYSAEVYNPRTGMIVAVSEGSCNSQEKKYKEQDSKNLVNTFQKMAEKRAMVGATLMACRASDIFTDEEEPQDKEPEAGRPAQEQQAQSQAPSGDLISEPQRKRFFAIWKDSGKTEEEVKAKLLATIGSDSSKNITRAAYESLCTWAQAGDAQEA